MSNSINPVHWFEIPATDMERAKTFYESVFGLELTVGEMGPLAMAFFPWDHTAAGAPGAIVQGDGYTPSHHGSMVYFDVLDIDETLKRVTEKGGEVINPRMPIGEHGFIAHFQDSEGNRVALHSNPKQSDG